MRVARAPYWLFVVFLAGSLMVVGTEQLAYLSTFPGAWFLSLLLLGVTACRSLLIYRLDQSNRRAGVTGVDGPLWVGSSP